MLHLSDTPALAVRLCNQVTRWQAGLLHCGILGAATAVLYTELLGWTLTGTPASNPGTLWLPRAVWSRGFFRVCSICWPCSFRAEGAASQENTCLWESHCGQTSWESFVIMASGPTQIGCCLIIETIYYWYQKCCVIKQRSRKHPYSAKNISSSFLVLQKAGETRKPSGCEKENVECIRGLGRPEKSPQPVAHKERWDVASGQVSGLRINCHFCVCVTCGYHFTPQYFDFSLCKATKLKISLTSLWRL